MRSTGRGILPIGSVGMVIGVGIAIHTVFLKHESGTSYRSSLSPRDILDAQDVLPCRPEIQPVAAASLGRLQAPQGSLGCPDWACTLSLEALRTRQSSRFDSRCPGFPY